MTFKPDDQIGPGTVLCADNQTGRRSVAPGMAGDDPSAEPDDGWLKRGLESAASVATSARITPEDGPLHIPSPTGDLLDHEAHIKRPSLPDGAILRTLARVVVELWDSPSWRNIHVTECEVRQVKDWLARK